MRKNFAQILKEANIDIKEEYKKLYRLMYNPSIPVSELNTISMHDELGLNFLSLPIRKTCLTIHEFDVKNGFIFQEEPENFNIDLLISLCEYMYNMLFAYQRYSCYQRGNAAFYISQILILIESIGYMPANENGLIIFVEKSSAAISVSEVMAPEVSCKVLSYNHYLMKGKLEEKKNTLLLFANVLEAKRAALKSIDSGFSDDLFYAFNNLNIRHNNIDPTSSKYKEAVRALDKNQLEQWYDEIYQMCLLAFLRLEHVVRKQRFQQLKDNIENKK